MAAKFHLAENAFTLHFLLQNFQRLINVVIAYTYTYHVINPFQGLGLPSFDLAVVARSLT